MNPLNPEDIEDLKQLIDFLRENQVAEFELNRGDLKLRFRFNQAESAGTTLSDLTGWLADAKSAAKSPITTTTGAVATGAAAPAADGDAGLHVVKSPIVGTFYGSPSPGAAPFVAAGDRVEKGQVICIVEAMKLMNEIESDAGGEIVKCFVSNGQAIEFGQPLFSIRLD